MERFNLDTWLKNKSRKVVTKDGMPVRIVCWDKLDDRPAAKEQKIVALIKEGCKENVFMYNNNGDGCISALDLFFADEEEELTEFEKEVDAIIDENIKSNIGVKYEARNLLNLARKELEANYYTKVVDDRIVFKSDLHDRDLQGAYELGKQDALKDLPKWKKATEKKDLEKHIAILEDSKVLLSNYLEEGDYYIVLDDLKTLPKEE